MEKKRLLFIPVSSSEGIGEYMRSLSFAHYLDENFPDRLDIHFLLNKHTNYALDCPFDTTLIEQSATKETRKVNQLIEIKRFPLLENPSSKNVCASGFIT